MRIGALDRKILRDAWHIRGQIVACALVVAGGINSFVSLSSVNRSQAASQAAFYEEYRFADVFAGLVRAPEQLAGALAAIPGVAVLETRVAVRGHITDAAIIDKVIFTGFLPDEELVLLLNRSEVLVLPSLIEGLGLPALEAAACRCPVIATIESPLPDLLGKGGIFIAPLDQGELERALISVLGSKDLQREMGAAGAAAVGQLAWEKSAQQMLEIISETAGT